MNYKSANEIRRAFLDFFKSKQHQVVASAPIVVKNDPTLLFTNAGMNQFKDYFLGNKTPEYKRIADTQKCLRVSGKHNDLEEVGVDTYHHTMFEMLGNWSFGDYFKEEAIAWSWELLTDVLQLEKDRLYVTVFEGDQKDNLPKDRESFDFWKKWIAEDRILLGNKKDNFWEMGDTGPCGPCTEIHVDCRSEEERKSVDGKTLVNADHPQVIEIWNNVFIQFNRLKDGSLEQLPAKHVDTGMGFERLVRVLQQKSSNYDTDVFSGTIAAVENLIGKKYDGSDSKQAVAFRVLADHIRAVSFTIADGQLPGRDGAGYVIRKILRRAVFYYFTFLDRKVPLLHLLVPILAKQFEEVFPELKKQSDYVSKIIYDEEQAFFRTIDKGLMKIENLPRQYWQEQSDIIYGDQYDPKNSDKANYIHNKKNIFVSENIANKTPIKLSGKIAFELYDTYGFPIDLTKLIANQKKWEVDEIGFDNEMQKQKTRSRAATEVSMGDWIVLQQGSTKFVGYHTLETESSILKYRKIEFKGTEQFQVVLDITPFYAESGGQVGDTGYLSFGGWAYEVVDTKKENDLIIHFLNSIPDDFNGRVIARVNEDKRNRTKRNHTATHLLHAALRQILGMHVEQKGSLNNSEYLRFDFSHFAKISNDDLIRIESLVNDKILENFKVIIEEMPKDEAMKLGAMALFGEKYGNIVRVVSIDDDFSVELCGGTHVNYTGEIGLFKIESESAVASGVRRIEAVSGKGALDYINNKLDELAAISAEFKNPKDLLKVLQDLREDNAIRKKLLETFQLNALSGIKNTLREKVIEKNGVNVIVQKWPDLSADNLKKIAFDLKNEINNLFFVAASVKEDKAFIAVLISDNLVKEKNLNANTIVKELAKHINGGGGGQPFFASASGTNVQGLETVLKEAFTII